MKADLHVHSKYSKRPSQWVLQKIDCPESFTEPMRLYKIAKKKGMSLVTITDHNTVAGAMELSDMPDTFVSEEITTYFPEDGCKIHVLAYDIDERQHEDIQKARQNIFELVSYLRAEEIVHVVAHPAYSINDRLSPEHFEELLLLFKNFELNGARGSIQNEVTRFVVSELTPADIECLVDKHAIEPRFPEPWKKNLTGGSDDHSSLNIGRLYTEVPGSKEVCGFLRGIEENKAKIIGEPSTPRTLAHNVYGIAYQFYRDRFGLERHMDKDILLRLLDRFLGGNQTKEGRVRTRLYDAWNRRKKPKARVDGAGTVQDLFRHESQKLIRDDPELMGILKNANGDLHHVENKWFEFANNVSNKVLTHFGSHFFDNLTGVNLFNIFGTIGSAGALYSVLAPYFVAFSLFSKDRQVAQRIQNHFHPRDSQQRKQTHVGHFTDTFYEVNGVAMMLRQHVQTAAKTGKQLTVITCDAENRGNGHRVRNFEPIGVSKLPMYPEQKLFHPPFLEMLDFCYENNLTHIHSATPGPIGLAALVIARILNLPIYGTYHTAIPQYAGCLTNDNTIEDITWKYILWYYSQMDLVFVSSEYTAEELKVRGIRPEKLRFLPRGIDVERFNPSKNTQELERRFGLGPHPRLLYVGRVSKEKNLELLTRVFRDRISPLFDASLTVVGDGPYLPKMQEALKGTQTVFTGYLDGEELPAVYASSDIFLFPSSTDTFGNVVLEAQASGLPVIVSDVGGPQENVIPGKTGLVVPANDEEAFFEGIQSLLLKSGRLTDMSTEARRYMEERSFDKAFEKTWQIYEKRAFTEADRDAVFGGGQHGREMH